MTTVWAHTLAGSDVIARAVPRVEAELLRLLGQPRGQVDLNVDPASGWISALVRDQRTRRRPVLLPAADARKRAAAFLRELARKLRPGPDLPMAFVPPLPDDPLELTSVPHPRAPEWNHWLYRTQPRLPTTRGGAAAPVLGAALEIRIGDGGRIVGFHSRWRPTTGERLTCEATAAPTDDHGEPGDQGSQGAHDAPHDPPRAASTVWPPRPAAARAPRVASTSSTAWRCRSRISRSTTS